MTTAYTSLLGLALPVTGELSGTWGSMVDNAITSPIDIAVAGTQSITGDSNVTLSVTNGDSVGTNLAQVGSGTTGSAQYAIILCTGARTVLRTITAPAASKIYTVINATTGGFGVKVVGVGPTTGVTIAAGESAVIAWNGSDFIKISNTGGAVSFTNVTVTGTTTLSGLTASTALALDASKNVVSVTNTGTGNNVLATSPTLVTPILGTPTSVTLTNATGLPLSTGVTGTLATTNGGTGLTSYTAGDLPYYAAGTVLSKLAIGTAGQILTVNSGATAPQWSTLSGVAVTTFSAGTTGFTPSTATTGAVTLAGTLATTNGGTGLTSFTANGVVYASSTSALATGSALTFDGTTLVGNAAYGSGTAALILKNTSAAVVSNIVEQQFWAADTFTGLTQKGAFGLDTSTGVGNQYGSFYWKLANAGAPTEQMRLTSTGLGIGTSSPDQKLVVQGGSGTAGMKITDGTYSSFLATISSANNYGNGSLAGQLYLRGQSGIGFTSNNGGATQMALTDTGNLLVGTTSSFGKLTINSNGAPASSGNMSTGLTIANGTGGTAINIGTYDAGSYNYIQSAYVNSAGTARALAFFLGSTQAMTLDASGRLLVSTTSSTGANAKLVAGAGNASTNGVIVANTANGTYSGLTLSNWTGIATTNGPYIMFDNSGVGGWAIGSGNGVNTFDFCQTWGTPLVRIDSSGNLLIGRTTGTGANLDVYESDSNDATIRIGNSQDLFVTAIGKQGATSYGATSAGQAFLYCDNSLSIMADTSTGVIKFSTGGNAERARIDSSGNLGVGTTSPANKLSVTGSTGTIASFTNGATADFSIICGASATSLNAGGANVLAFQTGGTERARIDSIGDLMVGTTSSEGPSKISVAQATTNQACIGMRHTGGAGEAFVRFINAANTAIIGSITNNANTGVLYNVTSDQRLKENIVNAPEFGSIIDSIKVRSYDWITDQTHQRAGFIAQELVTVVPEAVHQPSDTEQMMAVDYSKLVPMLVKEIQSLRKRLADAGI